MDEAREILEQIEDLTSLYAYNMALSELGPSAIPDLLEALDDLNGSRVAAALWALANHLAANPALGQTGDWRTARVIALLGHVNDMVRGEAARVLGWLKTPQAIPALADRADDEAIDGLYFAPVWLIAVDALAKIDTEAAQVAVADICTARLSDPDSKKQAQAAQYLERSPRESARQRAVDWHSARLESGSPAEVEESQRIIAQLEAAKPEKAKPKATPRKRK